MEKEELQDLIDRFDEFAFTVARKIVAVTKEQIGGGLTSDQHLTMRYIKKYGPCTSSELADVFYVNKSAITAIMNRLSDKGYIERIPDTRDRRVIHLQLTERGREVVTEGEERVRKIVGMYLSRLEKSEIATFLRTFEKLANIVKDS